MVVRSFARLPFSVAVATAAAIPAPTLAHDLAFAVALAHKLLPVLRRR